MPLVTIIIVNYNSGDRLPRVLSALAAQTFRDFEVVVYDNASSDGSESISPPDSMEIRVVKSAENTGFAGGVMAAMAYARGGWIALLNPDAYPEPGWLEALMTAADRYGERSVLGSIQLVEGQADLLDGLGDTYHASGVAWRGGFGKPAAGRLPDGDREIFAACFAAALLHKKTFLDEGGLDTDFFCYHEDVDYGFRHRLYGGRAILVRDAVIHHEGSGITGRYSDFTVFHGIRNRMWTLVKNMPTALLPVTTVLYLVFSLAFLIRSFMLKIGKPYCRGWWAGLKELSRVWRERQSIQVNRAVSVKTISRAMSWSPIAPFMRAPDLRPLSTSPRPATSLAAPKTQETPH